MGILTISTTILITEEAVISGEGTALQILGAGARTVIQIITILLITNLESKVITEMEALTETDKIEKGETEEIEGIDLIKFATTARNLVILLKSALKDLLEERKEMIHLLIIREKDPKKEETKTEQVIKKEGQKVLVGINLVEAPNPDGAEKALILDGVTPPTCKSIQEATQIILAGEIQLIQITT